MRLALRQILFKDDADILCDSHDELPICEQPEYKYLGYADSELLSSNFPFSTLMLSIRLYS
jgi:hypothetical protein